jgi:hypothetical protein
MPERLGTGSSSSKLSEYVPLIQKGATNGVAELGPDGIVPSEQLPVFVDDVLIYDNMAAFPIPGSDGIVYIAKDTNISYRWSSEEYEYQSVGGGAQSASGLNKQVQFNDGGMLGSSQEFLYDKDQKAVVIGKVDVLPDNPLGVGGNVDSYLQVNLQNISDGINASADYVVTADNGDDAINYMDMGIANSGYNVPEWSYAEPDDGYLLSVGGHLAVVAGLEGKEIRMFAGSMLAEDVSAKVTISGIVVPEGKSYKVGNFNVLDLIAEASSAEEEGVLFASGAKIVIRTDLL